MRKGPWPRRAGGRGRLSTCMCMCKWWGDLLYRVGVGRRMADPIDKPTSQKPNHPGWSATIPPSQITYPWPCCRGGPSSAAAAPAAAAAAASGGLRAWRGGVCVCGISSLPLCDQCSPVDVHMLHTPGLAWRHAWGTKAFAHRAQSRRSRALSFGAICLRAALDCSGGVCLWFVGCGCGCESKASVSRQSVSE